MKTSFLLMLAVLLVGCSAGNSANISSQSEVTIINEFNSNAANSPLPVNVTDESKTKEISLQQAESEKFRVVPDEFKNIDFRNFRFPDVNLKDGKYESFSRNNPLEGSQTFSLKDVYYVDISGDSKKEAVVFLSVVSCGGSCDGGSLIVYFYSSEEGNAKLIDKFETGTRASGCFIESFAIKEKKIYIEQFGQCLKNSAINSNVDHACKFCVKDSTKTVYTFINNRLKRESGFELESPVVNVMNYQPEININY